MISIVSASVCTCEDVAAMLITSLEIHFCGRTLDPFTSLRFTDVTKVTLSAHSRCAALETPNLPSTHHPHDSSRVAALLSHSPILSVQPHNRSAQLTHARPTHLTGRRLQPLRYNDATVTMRATCLPNVSVAVHVNGDALHEYHADSEYEKTALCYVEAVSGAEFSLVLTTEPGYAYPKGGLQFRVFLDGNRARSIIVTPTKKGSTSSIDSVRRHIDGVSYYMKFIFARLETSTYHIPMSVRQNQAVQLTRFSRQATSPVTRSKVI